MILDVIKSLDTHPTADAVYEILRQTEPNISLGTVYRNLNMLAANGKINLLHTADEKIHFDGDTTAHQHFICKQCGKIVDVYCDTEVPASLSQMGVCVDESQTIYYGKCKSCTENNLDCNDFIDRI